MSDAASPHTGPPINKFRGAVVEDLDLAPALSINPTTPIATALALSYDRDYSQLTVVDADTRALLGYVTADALKNHPNPYDGVDQVMARFRRKGRSYRVITPATPLEELWVFLFGEKEGEGEEFAVVTDEARRFVLGVATREDLKGFLERRMG